MKKRIQISLLQKLECKCENGFFFGVWKITLEKWNNSLKISEMTDFIIHHVCETHLS